MLKTMVTVERTAESVIFKVPATLDDQAIERIEAFIVSLESSEVQATPYSILDENGFVNDPDVLEDTQAINRAGLMGLKERFENAPEFAGLFKEEE